MPLQRARARAHPCREALSEEEDADWMKRTRAHLERQRGRGENEIYRWRSYLNDVYKIFWFFDPLPPLVCICLIFSNPPHLQMSYLASTPPQVVPALLFTVLIGY